MVAKYDNRGVSMFTMIFKMRGSSIPKASVAASISAGMCIMLNLIRLGYIIDAPAETLASYVDVVAHPLGSQLFSTLLGYVVVFRTNMALSRYWAGCTDVREMFSKWIDSFSLIASFLKSSHIKKPKNLDHCIAHWFSLMAALAITRLRATEPHFAIPPVRHLANFRPRKKDLPHLDFSGTDFRNDPDWFLGCLREVSAAELERLDAANNKIRIIASWIVNSVEIFRGKGWIECHAPILTRAYQELSNGMMGCDQAAKLCAIPFPFPFMQIITVLLIANTFQLPFVIAQFTQDPIWSVFLTFFVGLGYWGMYFICVELENPYGEDVNDLPLVEMQREFCAVISQIRASRIPQYYIDQFGMTVPTESSQVPNPTRRKVEYKHSTLSDSYRLGCMDTVSENEYGDATHIGVYRWK